MALVCFLEIGETIEEYLAYREKRLKELDEIASFEVRKINNQKH